MGKPPRSIGMTTTCGFSARASDDLSASDNNLRTMVGRALRRQTNDPDGLQLGLGASDEALALPEGRALVIVDGFDEIALPPAEVERFFALLRDESSAHVRFVVLGRPEALREPTDNRDRWQVTWSRICSFGDEEARRWVENWNGHAHGRRPITWDLVAKGPLRELVQTPVLLFMVAFTLSDPCASPSGDGITDAVALYESFCFAMARGKLSQSGERHQVIETSAKRLADALEGQHWSGVDSAASDRLPQAMLWLMSRIAWEACVRGEQPLRKRHIEALLEEVLDMDDAEVDAVLVGSLLALQSDLTSGKSQLFFGHRSFQEYLAARWWHVAIDHLSGLSSRSAQRRFERANLCGAALLTLDQAYSFTITLLQPSVLSS